MFLFPPAAEQGGGLGLQCCVPSTDLGIISLPEQDFCPKIRIIPTLRIGAFVPGLTVTSGLEETASEVV